MKAVAVIGSYRRGGVTEQAVDALLEGAAAEGAEVDSIRLSDHEIGFCSNCRACMQSAGDQLGECPLVDDARELILRCAGADVLIAAAPVNMGSTTALMKRFIERLACTADWPWGKPAPRFREWVPAGRIAAVLVTSSAAPGLLGRLGGFSGLRDLGWLAKAFRARVVAKRWYGMAGKRAGVQLTERQRAGAVRLGRRVVAAQRRRQGGG